MAEILEFNQKQIFVNKVKKYAQLIVGFEKDKPGFDKFDAAVYGLHACLNIFLFVLRNEKNEKDFEGAKKILAEFLDFQFTRIKNYNFSDLSKGGADDK